MEMGKAPICLSISGYSTRELGCFIRVLLLLLLESQHFASHPEETKGEETTVTIVVYRTSYKPLLVIYKVPSFSSTVPREIETKGYRDHFPKQNKPKRDIPYR